MNWSAEYSIFLYKVISLVVTAPLFAYGTIYLIDMVESAWKSNNRKKKWLALTVVFIALGIFLGRLQ